MIVKNIAYLYAIQLLRLGLPLVLLSLLTNVLTSVQYSIYVYTLACAGWLSIFVEYGFTVSATRRIAATSQPCEVRNIILQTQAARLLLVAASVIFPVWAVLGSSVFSAHTEWALSAWLMGASTGVTPTYYYQATSRLKLVALLEVGGGIVTLTIVLMLIQSPGDFWRLCTLLVIVRLMVYKLLERQMHKDYNLSWNEYFRIKPATLALKDGFRVFLVQIATSLYTSFNIVLLGGVSTAYAVAVYGSGERLIRAGLSFIGQATAAIFPSLNSLSVSDTVRLWQARRRTLITFGIGGLFSVLVIWVFAPLISNTLFHGRMPELIATLRVMAWVVPAIAISNVLAFHFLVVDYKEQHLNRVVFAAVPVSLATGYVLSREWGALGMAVTWVVVEWLVTIGLAASIYRNHHRSQLHT